MLDLVLTNKDGEGVANSIKDKTKAIARYVAGLKLTGRKPEFSKYGSRTEYWGTFKDFGNQALKLGATENEIQEAFDNTTIPTKYSDKQQQLGTKKLSSMSAGAVSQALLKAGYDINFLKHNGYALTQEGKEAMSRNGRKWTIGVKSEITLKNGKKVTFDYDAITSEGVDDTLVKYVASSNSEVGGKFTGEWKQYGIREFIGELLKILKTLE